MTCDIKPGYSFISRDDSNHRIMVQCGINFNVFFNKNTYIYESLIIGNVFQIIFFKQKTIFMKHLILLSALTIVFFSCNNSPQETSSNPDDKDFSKEQMDTIFNKQAKTINQKNLVKYTSVAGQGAETKIDLLSTESPTGCAAFPTKISELSDGSDFEYYKFTSDRSADAKLFGFGGNIDQNEILIVRDYVRYKFVDCGGIKKKYGIGLRCFLEVKKLKGSVSATLPNIAASVQLNKGNAIYTLKSLGFAIGGDIIADGLAGQGDYNVDNFAKIEMTFTNVLKTLTDSSKVKFSPVELPIEQ